MNDELGESTVSSLGLDVPPWIDQGITPYTVEAIQQGGCASGAYMPAVTYYQAAETMAEHGDAIFDYLEVAGIPPAEVVANRTATFWSGWACALVSTAVELWAGCIDLEELEALEEEE